MIQIRNVNGDTVNKWLNFTLNWYDHTGYARNSDGMYEITVDNEVPVILRYSDSKVFFDLGAKLFWLDKTDYSEIVLT